MCYFQMARVMKFWKDERFRTIHVKYVVENVEKFMPTLQLRSRPTWNSGMAHTFLYMMDE